MASDNVAEIVYREGFNESMMEGSVIVTGFRGFGMVGYLVSNYIAKQLEAENVGYILVKPMPPFILVEEDGVGFPFEIYFSRKHNSVVVVNRALPEKEHADTYVEVIAGLAKRIKAKYVVLVGGLNRNYIPENEKYGYRHLPNKYYKGPELEAPQMEQGLGVLGPLALLYIYLDYYRVPAIIVLPYAVVEEADYSAAILGVKVVSEKLLEASIDTSRLEEEASRIEEEKEKIIRYLAKAEEEREKEHRGGMYM